MKIWETPKMINGGHL